MKVIKARNVNRVLPEIMYELEACGIRTDSRNGPVIRFPEPVTILYEKPWENVLFWAERDANPFFHLLEAMWMLDGRNDLAFPASIVKSMINFSDDGEVLQGAYGWRWRNYFGFDQLCGIVDILTHDPNSRRAVLTMWDPKDDLHFRPDSKDLPCNTHIYFAINDGKLDMTVCNRSNDIVWGALGANVVHMSILQEFMAAGIGVPMGRYWQISNNMHLYLEEHEELMKVMASKAFPSKQAEFHDPYTCGVVKHYPLVPSGNVVDFERDNQMVLEIGGCVLGMSSQFIRKIVAPMLQAIRVYKQYEGHEKYYLSLVELESMPKDSDWYLAGKNWITKRQEKWKKKQHEKEN